MNIFHSRKHHKSFLEKLFNSPNDRGIMDAPCIYMLVGAGFSIYAVIGMFEGKMDVGRYSTNVIYYNDNPGFYVFCVLTLLALGVGFFMWGCRLWHRHDD